VSNPYIVDQLTPVNTTGQSTKTYQLTKDSVSPSRVIGRDEIGMPIFDTVPTVPWKWFLSADGCFNKVPLRTGSAPNMNSQDSIAYELETIHDIVTAGFIPAWLCPYSTKMTHITNGPFAAIPPGESDCGGSDREGGCVHLQRIGELRRAKVRETNEKAEKAFNTKRDEEYARMRNELVEGVGMAIAKHATPQAAVAVAKQRLRDGKGEVEG
jgi:hypothetical protein